MSASPLRKCATPKFHRTPSRTCTTPGKMLKSVSRVCAAAVLVQATDAQEATERAFEAPGGLTGDKLSDIDQAAGAFMYITDGTGSARLGTPCHFPFSFAETEYTGCIVNEQTPDGWCGVTADVDRDGMWGGCTTPDELMQSLAALPPVCPPGAFTLPDGMCQLCEPGHFSEDINASSCQACVPGTATRAPGSLGCSRCGLGEYAKLEGSLVCETCPPNTYNDKVGATTCFKCPVGEYAPLSGSSRCIPIMAPTRTPTIPPISPAGTPAPATTTPAPVATTLVTPSQRPTLAPAAPVASSEINSAASSKGMTFRIRFGLTGNECLTAPKNAGDKLKIAKCQIPVPAAQEFELQKQERSASGPVALRTMTKDTYRLMFRNAKGDMQCMTKTGLAKDNTTCSTADAFTFLESSIGGKVKLMIMAPAGVDGMCMQQVGSTGAKSLSALKCGITLEQKKKQGWTVEPLIVSRE